MTEVKIYSLPDCVWCNRTKKFFKENNISYKDFNVGRSKKFAKEMILKSGQKSVPVIDVDGTIVIGFDKKKLSELLLKNEKKKKEYSCDVLVVGSGVTGLATAMYSARFGLKTIVVGDTEGGVITLTNEVSNYPGFKQVTGKELFEKIRDHALEYPVKLIGEKIDEVKKTNGDFLSESDNSKFKSKAVIFATGTKARKLKVSGEDEFFGKGVHTCALCDGPFYKGKVLGVVGGSDSATKEALLLAEYAKKVYIIYRGENIRAEPINLQRARKNKKIEVITNTNVLEIKGEKVVKSVIFDKAYKNKKEFKLDGLFIEIGHIPLSEVAKNLGVRLNKKGEIKVNRNSQTNLPGVFAAGDVVDTVFKQAITGVAEGVTASFHVYQYIRGLGEEKN